MYLKVVFVAFLVNCVCCATFSEGIFFPPQLSERIVDGADAKAGSPPYQVSLQSTSGEHFCGGTIIGVKWILTSGQCVSVTEPSEFKILTGTQNLKSGGKYYYADKIFMHSRYDKPKLHNYIALIRLNSSIEFNNLTQPIDYSWEELPDDAVLTLTSRCHLSGWRNNYSDSLQNLDVKYIPYEECKDKLSNSPNVDIGHVCTLIEYGNGECNGDAGNPLTYYGKLVGINNWGSRYASGYVQLHARISYYHDFIRTTINSN